MSIRSLHRLGVFVARATAGLASFAFATTASARAGSPKPTVVLVRRVRRLVEQAERATR